MIDPLDLRLNAFRPDIAASSLRGRVVTRRFVDPVMMRVADGRLALFGKPDLSGPMISELRHGEFVDVYENRNNVAWLQNRADGYVGYAVAGGLSETLVNPVWRLVRLWSYVYAAPSIKSVPVDMIPFPARIAVADAAVDGWVKLMTGGYMQADQIEPVETLHADYVFTAGRLLNVPYLWGGRTALGVDCSGLVQMALELAGIECPRDSDMQAALFGAPPPSDWRDYPFARGDLVFFPGHVGLMADATHLVHANQTHNGVTSEPLADVVERGAEIIAVGAGERVRAA